MNLNQISEAYGTTVEQYVDGEWITVEVETTEVTKEAPATEVTEEAPATETTSDQVFMPDTETYFRYHRPDAPEFNAENAYSAGWGEIFTSPGTYECGACDGIGKWLGERCSDCGGEGEFEADSGYSCCCSAEALVAYFSRHCSLDADDPIVEFEGEHVGNGGDGEPLVEPTRIVRWTTYGQVRREVGN